MLRGVEVSTSARHGEVAASGVEAATRMLLKVAVHDAVAGVWWLAEVLLRDGCMGVAASGGSSRRAAASRGATASGDAMVRRIQAGAVRR